jgi:hypothetical protein
VLELAAFSHLFPEHKNDYIVPGSQLSFFPICHIMATRGNLLYGRTATAINVTCNVCKILRNTDQSCKLNQQRDGT